jgi:hypothetical protein
LEVLPLGKVLEGERVEPRGAHFLKGSAPPVACIWKYPSNAWEVGVKGGSMVGCLQGEEVRSELACGAASSMQENDGVRMQLPWLRLDNMGRWEGHFVLARWPLSIMC